MSSLGRCDSSCICKLGTLFVSVKYVFVSVKLVYVYVKLLKILSASKKGIFVIKEKPRVIFAKCIWIVGNFKISKRWFCKHVFLTLFPVKNIYLSKSFI
jgi:hypothetical protein